MWSSEDMEYFEKASANGLWGDKELKDEYGEGDWAWELIHCELIKETFTDAKDLVEKVSKDAKSGDFTVEDIFNKYVVLGY